MSPKQIASSSSAALSTNRAKAMKQSSTKIGLLLISVAVLAWGLLPIALKLSTTFIDPVSFTWFRFILALIFSLAIQTYTKQLHQFKHLTKKGWGLLLLCTACSVINYISFVASLNYLSPGQAQLNFQTAPFFLAFGGILFFKERLTALQMAGFATLALGMLLFLHPYLNINANGDNGIWLGVLIIQFSALSWTSYALIQKVLVKQLSPNNILLFIYGFGVIALLPMCDFSSASSYNTEQWLIIFYAAFNTLLAYSCFAQSMKYLSTAQTGAMIALTPILSFAATYWAATIPSWQDTITTPQLDWLSSVGVVLVIVSVIAIQVLPSLLRKRGL